ncbi:MAG: acyloxyacyl hydrolase [Bacteroidia bacterium]
MNQILRYLFSIIFIILIVDVLAQQKKNHYGFGLKFLFGYHAAANRQSLYLPVYDANGNIVGRTWDYGPSMDGFPLAIDLSLLRINKQQTKFNQYFGNPLTGITYTAMMVNNTDTFGFNHAVVPFAEVRLKQTNKYQLNAHVGYGLSYVTKLYDFEKNFDNRAIATPINFALNFGLSYHIKLAEKRELSTIIKYHHVSNGSTKMPNGGFNMLLVGIGLNFTESDFFNLAEPNNLKTDERYFYIMSHIAGSYREIGYFRDTKGFYVLANSNTLFYKINQLLSLGAGVDFFYDPSPYLSKNISLPLSKVYESNKKYAGAGFASNFRFSRFFIPVGFYTYLNNRNNMLNQNYIRFGLGFQLTEKFYCGSFFKGTLKGGTKLESDFMEWSLGFKLPFKRNK